MLIINAIFRASDLWQYGLWSFKPRDTKLTMSLPLDRQKTKLLMTNNWKLTFFVRDHPFKTSANFHDFWPLPPYHRHFSKMLMKGIFYPYVLWPFYHRHMETPYPPTSHSAYVATSTKLELRLMVSKSIFNVDSKNALIYDQIIFW